MKYVDIFFAVFIVVEALAGLGAVLLSFHNPRFRELVRPIVHLMVEQERQHWYWVYPMSLIAALIVHHIGLEYTARAWVIGLIFSVGMHFLMRQLQLRHPLLW